MKKKNWKKKLLIVFICLPIFFVLLFVFNGLNTSWHTPEFGLTGFGAKKIKRANVRIMAYNIAKCFFHKGGFSFRSVEGVKKTLDAIANLIQSQKIDIVFLSEVNFECAVCPVNQVEYLARKTKMHCFVFGENYSWGLPFFRIRSGNAILSKFPLHPLKTEQLAGGKPFYNPTNNRRIVWAELTLNKHKYLCASLRNDSFSVSENLVHAKQILKKLGTKTALLGGDFNADSNTEAIRLFEKSGLFQAEFHGPATYPTNKPSRCIDFIMAPKTWKLLDHKIILSNLSDHLPVVSVFEIP